MRSGPTAGGQGLCTAPAIPIRSLARPSAAAAGAQSANIRSRLGQPICPPSERLYDVGVELPREDGLKL